MLRRSASTPFVVATTLSCIIAGFGAATVAPRSARADDTIRRRGNHPHYHVEVEPHGSISWGGVDGFYGGAIGLSVPPGIRIGIPIVENGFVPTINNSVAISFGFDALYYPDCWFAAGSCSAWYIELPVTMQWNFYVSQHWSVFGEPGFFIYHGFFNDCTFANNAPCRFGPTGFQETGFYPAFFAGARYHFNDQVALTMRVGYPMLTIGVSFFP
ncbi:MAG: hypothetical protein FWD17_05310 [Polyangiaceae bacterium]|nr:hypothetical protein [Polyangiaceae bacterium]